ncbi:MAG TPA: toll/interleukin-1 receptor domain-containing protein [Bacteroidia bacterium]|jgi:hypothetical protein|nr:toll/interleukin-1 receptor domain-containing protein [Bacteroidia bacterium]
MAYLTNKQLLEFQPKQSPQQINEMLAKAAPKYGTDGSIGLKGARVFISHSHYDTALIKKAKLYLLSQGASIYVDLEDTFMPDETSPDTGRILKTKIDGCDKFIMLASTNALNSKWVPWELGYADKAIGIDNVAIFPVADDTGRWKGSEYMGLYPEIQMSLNEQRTFSASVMGPSADVWLTNWLQRK